jgi:hypothetical protein
MGRTDGSARVRRKDVSTKPRSPKVPAAAEARWRIMRGEAELMSFASEELARKRWSLLNRTVAGHGARLLRPDGTVEAE